MRFGSALYVGHVTHSRTTGVAHRFRYPVYLHLLDLAELGDLDSRLRLFGCDRWRPISFHQGDHLGGGPLLLEARLLALFTQSGVAFPGGRVLLLTHCRVFGYTFNPVSFFWCFDREDRLAAVVAEVRNTFGEHHPYLLQVRDGRTVWHEKKLMHVSPFFSMAGSYHFELPAPGERVEATIDLCHGAQTVLAAHLSLARRPLSDRTLAGVLLAYPLMPLRVIGAIHWQALRLWAKGLPVYSKPAYDPEAARREPA